MHACSCTSYPSPCEAFRLAKVVFIGKSISFTDTPVEKEVGSLLVIAFARKKDAQPILSIEDFWGGVLIGFLAGFLGKSFLDRFIQPS